MVRGRVYCGTRRHIYPRMRTPRLSANQARAAEPTVDLIIIYVECDVWYASSASRSHPRVAWPVGSLSFRRQLAQLAANTTPPVHLKEDKSKSAVIPASCGNSIQTPSDFGSMSSFATAVSAKASPAGGRITASGSRKSVAGRRVRPTARLRLPHKHHP
jgi:hypothetical protein